MKRSIAFVAFLIGTSMPLVALPPRERPTLKLPPKVWKADASFNMYSGDYGTGEETDTNVTRFKFTRYFDQADVSLVVPFISVTGRTAVTSGGGKPKPGQAGKNRSEDETDGGLGDLLLGAHTVFLEELGGRPEIGGTAFLKIPTADEDDGLGTGEFDEGIRAEFFKSLENRFFGFLDLGYTFVGDPENIDYNNRWLFSLGAGRMLDEKLSVSVFFTEERESLPGEENARDITLSLDLALKKAAAVYAAVLLGLSDGSPDTGFTIGGRFRF